MSLATDGEVWPTCDMVRLREEAPCFAGAMAVSTTDVALQPAHGSKYHELDDSPRVDAFF